MASSSAGPKIYIMVAKEIKNGIGNKGKMPWPRINTDMKFMETMTKKTRDKTKQNAAIMGRLTWESIPAKYRPLPERFNIVLSSKKFEDISPGAHMVCSSLSVAMEKLRAPPLSDQIENVWILGGSGVYEESMKHPDCDKLYVTEVLQEFPCDAFCPPIDTDSYKPIDHSDDPDVPNGEFVENGVKFKFEVYQRQ